MQQLDNQTDLVNGYHKVCTYHTKPLKPPVPPALMGWCIFRKACKKSVNKLNDQEGIDGTTNEHNRPSKEHIDLSHNGAEYFLVDNSHFF